MEFDLTTLLSQLGGAAPFFIWLLIEVRVLRKQMNNGIMAEVKKVKNDLALLPCKTGDCPEEAEDVA